MKFIRIYLIHYKEERMSASLPIDVLTKYEGQSTVFVETGSSEGDTIQTAIDAGFKLVLSSELDIDTFIRVEARFRSNPDVVIYRGLSTAALKQLNVSDGSEITFFLDAHPDCTSGPSPILEELEVMKKFKNIRTIFADDMRLMGLAKWTSTVPEIKKKILEINPNFVIELIANEHAQYDLLVAYLPED
jgi:hypothetical protein